MRNPAPEKAVWMVVQEKCAPQTSIAVTNMFVWMQMKVSSRNMFWFLMRYPSIINYQTHLDKFEYCFSYGNLYASLGQETGRALLQ